MSRILAYTTPGLGHLFPLTPILDELRRRGHQIAVRTLAAEVPLMQARGFEAAPISDQVEAIAHDDWRAGNPRAALARAVRVFAQRAGHDAGDLRRAIGEERPDVALVDVNAWGAVAAAEAWGGPWAAFCPYPLPLRSRDVPPFGPGLPPAHGPLGRLRDWLLRPVVFGTLERTMIPPINQIRAGLGLPPTRGVDEPVAVIASVPGGDPAQLPAPANARVARFIPHGPVLDRATCAITHGGMGATQKALARGVPVCAVPFGRDQLEVARRVEVAGAGSRLPASRLRPDRLRAKVREAMTMSAGAKRIQEAFAATGGTARRGRHRPSPPAHQADPLHASNLTGQPVHARHGIRGPGHRPAGPRATAACCPRCWKQPARARGLGHRVGVPGEPACGRGWLISGAGLPG